MEWRRDENGMKWWPPECQKHYNREGRLSLDFLTRNLFSHACPLLATELSLNHQILTGLSCLVVLEICTSTVASDVKYSVQKCSTILNRNYSCNISLYNILHGGNVNSKFHWKYPDSTVPHNTTIYNIITKLCCMGLLLEKNKFWKRHVMSEEKLDAIRSWLEASPKKSLTQQ
jgi:hypothetical protein